MTGYLPLRSKDSTSVFRSLPDRYQNTDSFRQRAEAGTLQVQFQKEYICRLCIRRETSNKAIG